MTRPVFALQIDPEPVVTTFCTASGRLSPHGMANPEPVLLLRSAVRTRSPQRLGRRVAGGVEVLENFHELGHVGLLGGDGLLEDLAQDEDHPFGGREGLRAALLAVNVATAAWTAALGVVALSAEGRFAFAASQGRSVAVFDGASGDRVLLIAEENRGVTSARFSPDERYLLVGYVNRTVELWDVTTGVRLERWHAPSRNPWQVAGAAVLEVGFAASAGRVFALAGDGRLLEFRRS